MSENLNLKTITTIDPSPFKHLCVTIGELPSSFLESMSYYELLAWFVNYLENTVIPAVNANGEATAELQENFTELNAAFNTLHDYVEHYFDNLDVQEEINHKLDEMVTDGTLTNIITPIVGNQIDQLAETVTTTLANYDTTIDNIAQKVGEQRMIDNRKKYYMGYNLVTKPVEFTEDFFKNINIYGNTKGNYKVNYNKNDFINQESTNTWYFAPDGNNSNSGTDAEHPKKVINSSMLSAIEEGDTLILASGFYPRGYMFASTVVNKSVNVICPDGEAVLTMYDDGMAWTQSGSNSWVATRSGVTDVFDITDYKDKKFSKLTKLTSASDVDNTPNSYYVDSSNNLYVHMYDNKMPTIETLALCISVGYAGVTFEAAANNMKVYMKNITFMGCNTGGVIAKAGSYTGCTILLDNVNVYLNASSGYNYDSFSNQGFYSICDHVTCYYSGKDAFNYHQGSGTTQALGIEIDCVSNNCGEGRTLSAQLSNNATTAHNSCKIIRVNGNYSYCNGGVAVDIDDVVSAFYNCLIADSYGRSYDLYASDTAKIYAYDCYFTGSSASTNMKTSNDAYIYYKDCEFDTTQGNVIDLDA